MARFGLTIQKEFLIFILLMGLTPAAIGVMMATQAGAFLFVRTMGGPLESRAQEIGTRVDRLCDGYDTALQEIVRQRGDDWDGVCSDASALENVDIAILYRSPTNFRVAHLGNRKLESPDPLLGMGAYFQNLLVSGKVGPEGFFDDVTLNLTGAHQGGGRILHVYPAPSGGLIIFFIEVDPMLQQIRSSLADQNDVMLYSPQGYMLSSQLDPPSILVLANQNFKGETNKTSGMINWRRRESGHLQWHLVAYTTSRRLARLTNDGHAHTPWAVLVSYDMDGFLSPYTNLVWFSIVIALIWALLLMGLSIWAASRIVGPIKYLRWQAEAMASGDLDARVDIHTRDELEDLAVAFNTMADKLRDSYARITRFNTELEQKVHERTRDLARANQKLIQTEKYAATARLAANLAHEINNPLGIIKNYLRLTINQLAKAGGGRRVTDPNLDRIKIINEELDRIARIVRQLLDLHRPVGEEVRPTNINDILDTILSLMDKDLDKDNIEIKRDYDPNLPLLLIAPDLIRQVLINLLRNAQDAMDKGGILTVKTETRIEWTGDGERRVICISISDTGCGIDEENAAKIFDPFFTTKSSDKGTGLGLSVSYGIVQSYHGLIEVSSTLGEGTTMTVILPINPPRRREDFPGNNDEERALPPPIEKRAIEAPVQPTV